jgi:putative addiction module component (TIGR02574 family)
MKQARFDDILELPLAERIRLVEAVWDSIAESAECLAIPAAQQTELDQRLDEFERQPETVSSWQEVKARIAGSK